MKKKLLFCAFTFLAFVANAQTNSNYEVKVQTTYGSILKHTRHLENLVKGPVTGAELAIEWQKNGDKSWEQYLNLPKTGLGAVYLNLGNPDTLGSVFALYPYIKLPIIRTKGIEIYMKPGAGISYLNKTFHHATAYYPSGDVNLNRSNAAIGSHLNVFFGASLNVDLPLSRAFYLTGEYGWNHVSNGSVIQPNSGINMMNGSIGFKYLPHNNSGVLLKKTMPNLPRKLTTELIISGGIRQLYYKDNRFFPAGSIAIATFYPLSNYYRMGLGADAFFDGVFGEINAASNATNNETRYSRTYISADKLTNKLRAGVSWQHELMMGKVTAGFHFGLYLYNPIKNLEPFVDAESKTLNKPLIYPYDIEKEDGWLYTRASIKYAFSEHIFAAIGLKTHLQKAEFIEWGIGYRF